LDGQSRHLPSVLAGAQRRPFSLARESGCATVFQQLFSILRMIRKVLAKDYVYFVPVSRNGNQPV
jgi:hypothetical protein